MALVVIDICYLWQPWGRKEGENRAGQKICRLSFRECPWFLSRLLLLLQTSRRHLTVLFSPNCCSQLNLLKYKLNDFLIINSAEHNFHLAPYLLPQLVGPRFRLPREFHLALSSQYFTVSKQSSIESTPSLQPNLELVPVIDYGRPIYPVASNLCRARVKYL